MNLLFLKESVVLFFAFTAKTIKDFHVYTEFSA